MAELPASAARIRRAWRAGLRGYSTWLVSGIACVIAATIGRGWEPQTGAVAQRVRQALAEQGDHAPTFAVEIVGDAAFVLAAMLALAASAMFVAALVLARLGPIEPDVGRGLGVAAVPVRMRLGVGLGALFLALASFELRARTAGAARAADASADGLIALWHGTALELVAALGLAMIAVGALEAWWRRSDRLVALQPTVQQARDEARDRGGRRR